MTTRVNGCQVVPAAAARAGQDCLSRLPTALLHSVVSFLFGAGLNNARQVCGMHCMSRICKSIGTSLSQRREKLTSVITQEMSEWEGKGSLTALVTREAWLNKLKVYFAHKPRALCTRDQNGRTILHTVCLEREEPLPESFVKSILALDYKHRLGLTTMADRNGKKLERVGLLASCWRVLSFRPVVGVSVCSLFSVLFSVLVFIFRIISKGTRAMPIGPKRIFFAALVLLLIYAGCVYHLVLFRPYNARVNGAYGPLAGRIHRLQQEVIKDIKGKKA